MACRDILERAAPTAFYDPPTSSGMARLAASIGSSRYPSLGGPATPSVVPTTVFITSAIETLTEAQIAEEPLAGSVLACIPGVRGIPAPYSLAERPG